MSLNSVLVRLPLGHALSQAERVQLLEVANVAVPHDDAFAHTIDAGHRAQQHACVVLASDQASNRPGDVGRRQTGRRHLVEQRLKKVMVLAVNQGDVHLCLGKPLIDREAGEAGADNDNARARAVRGAAGHELKWALLQRLRRMRGHRGPVRDNGRQPLPLLAA